MDLESVQKFKDFLEEYSFIHPKDESSWTYSYMGDYTLKLKIEGNLSQSSFLLLSRNFDSIQEEYFAKENFLVFIFDFSRFNKAVKEVRTQILNARLFSDSRIYFVFFGMNYFVSTMAKVLSNQYVRNRMFSAKTEVEAQKIAKDLIADYIDREEKKGINPNYYLEDHNKILIKEKEYRMVSKQNWVYNDPSSDFSYKIDLIDDDIFVARPTGYIHHQNSLRANILFDKVVGSAIKKGKTYYRIQDYSFVNGAESKARKDFVDYLIPSIHQINLMVFYGLNRSMKLIVRLGRLLHPTFSKIHIVNSFQDALELVIAHKYQEIEEEKEKPELGTQEKEYSSPQEEIADLKSEIKTREKDNEHLQRLLFERLTRIAFGDLDDFVPVHLDDSGIYGDLFSAIQLLNEDFHEIRNERNEYQKQLKLVDSEHQSEIRKLKIYQTVGMLENEEFVKTKINELDFSIETILNIIQYLRKNDNPNRQKELFQIVKNAGLTLQDSLRQLKNRDTSLQKLDVISDSMFNYRKNLDTLLEICQLGFHGSSVVFENSVDEAIPTFLIGDQRKFNQIVNIFLDNSKKHTSEGFIRLNTKLIKNTITQCHFRIEVEDSGSGMDKYIQDSLRQKESLKIPEKRISGLGLSIAKKLAELLNADWGFESEKNKGSKFWLELKFTIGFHDKKSQMYATRDQRKRKSKADLSFQDRKALLILDDLVKQNLLEEILQNKGIQPRAKLNYEFLSDMKAAYDFVFVSFHLRDNAEQNSFEALKKVLDSQVESEKPIYIGFVKDKRSTKLDEYRKIGVDYFLPKSYTIDQIDQFFEELK